MQVTSKIKSTENYPHFSLGDIITVGGQCYMPTRISYGEYVLPNLSGENVLGEADFDSLSDMREDLMERVDKYDVYSNTKYKLEITEK